MLKRPDPFVSTILRDLGQPWSVDRLSTVLGALGLAFIIAAGSFIAWKEHATAMREARDHAQGSAFFLADHAARLFEVSDLALRSTAMTIGTQEWDAIAEDKEIWTEMRATRSALPYVEDVRLNDAAGRLRMTTLAFPAPPSDVSDREIFRTLSQGTNEFAVGDPIVGRATQRPTFVIARRLAWPDGGFRGIVSATVDLDYFNSYWNRLDLPNEERIAIVRQGSGAVLARYPANAPVEKQPELALLAPAHPEAGSFSPGTDDVAFYHRVGPLPLYMVVSFTKSSVALAWRAWLWRFMPFPLAALLALVVIMVLGARQSRIEARTQSVVEAARAELSATNQRLEERVAERTLDLQESNEEIQRFAYVVSHDLRAPLVNIMGFTSELQNLRAELFAPAPPRRPDETAADPPPPRLQQDFDEALGFIQTSIDKMDRLIKAILLLSRQGQRSFLPEPIDMERLMLSIADGFAHRTQMMGATIAVGTLPSLVADRVAVEQIFSNLIDNAVKYLRPGVSGRIDISGFANLGKATYTVRDNGRGIDPRDRTRVFDLFRRSGPQDQSGEGIGLAHVRSLVRRLGGNIALESTLGSGSTFTVVLPLGPLGRVR